MKKIISIALALLMVAVMLPVMAMAEGATKEVSNQEQLTAAVAKGGNIKLANDIKLTDTLVVNMTVVLDMNGCKLYNESDIWNADVYNWSLISVRESGNLTITGNGTLKAKADDCYAADVQGDGAVLTIENGTLIGNISAVYAYTGKVYVNGGYYYIQQLSPNYTTDKERFTLNCYDENFKNGSAVININGGSFKSFNPAKNLAEGPSTNFAGDSLVIDADNFCVGNDAMNVISNTSAGSAVRIVNGNNISGVPAGVIIHNETGHDITVNGDNVPPQAEGDGDNNGYVVPNRSIIIYNPTEDTPKADDQKNPSTGANDFVGVAAAMAVVSLLGAAAVIRKK